MPFFVCFVLEHESTSYRGQRSLQKLDFKDVDVLKKIPLFSFLQEK